MNYRHALLLAPEDLGASGTKTIDLKGVVEPISRIELRFTTTKVLKAMIAPGPANISKIELVDGSRALHSLSGYENQALAYYSTPGISMEHGQHIGTLAEVDMYHINFGRYLWDPMLAFLPGRFKNPQLKVTFDEDVADTSVTANEMAIWLHMFDEKQVSPVGFLQAIEHDSYTNGAENSYKDTLLPTDHVIRQMLLRAYQDGNEPWVVVDEARLDENNLKSQPWEYTDLEYYYRRQKAFNPAIETPFVAEPLAAGRLFYVPQTDYWATIVLTNVASNQDIYISGANMKGGKATLIGTAEAQAVGIARGYLPWHCYQFPMGRLSDPDDWYNPAGKAPRLRTRAGSSGTSGTTQVVLEQLVTY